MNDNHRRQWCAAVAQLVYPVDPPRCVKALVTFLPMLADLPDEAFSVLSAEAVALADRRMAFPSYDEVAKPLRAWWRANRPAPQRYPQIEAAPPEPPIRRTPEEIAHVDALTKQFLAEVRARETATRPSGIKAAYLTPDQLRRSYSQAGAIIPPWLVESR